jgi:dynein heavy chain
VFADRTINVQDKDLISKTMLGDLTKEFFKDVEEAVMVDPIIFGDFALSSPTDEEAEDPRLYEDMGGFDVIKDKLDKMLEDYGFENKPMNLVLFNDALEHTVKI